MITFLVNEKGEPTETIYLSKRGIPYLLETTSDYTGRTTSNNIVIFYDNYYLHNDEDYEMVRRVVNWFCDPVCDGKIFSKENLKELDAICEDYISDWEDEHFHNGNYCD